MKAVDHISTSVQTTIVCFDPVNVERVNVALWLIRSTVDPNWFEQKEHLRQ